MGDDLPDAFVEAIHQLHAERVITFPTETVTALAADAASERGVMQLFALKQRPFSKPIPLLVPSVEHLRALILWSPLVVRFLPWMPGPLTLIVKLAPGAAIAKAVLGSREGQLTEANVAVRIPDHPIASALLRAYQRPLAATSANRSGGAPLCSEEALRQHFSPETGVMHIAPARQDNPPALPQENIASTIIDVTGPVPRCLRRGGLSSHELGV